MPGSSTWPQSWATIQRKMLTAPVSGSTSRTTPCVPLAKLDCDTVKSCVSSRPGDSPGAWPACAAAAISAHPRLRLGSPRTENFPPSLTISTGEASSRWAAIRIAFSRTTRAARSAALPPMAAVRLPYVPPPCATRSESPVSTSMVSGSMPRRLPTSRENIVTCPWPCGAAPVTTVTPPFSWTRTTALSWGTVAVAST